MKAMFLLMAGAVLTSYSTRQWDEDIDGVWMGYYRSNITKEKLVVKLNGVDKMEFYTGGVDDRIPSEGNYRMLGDSISFSCKTGEGQIITLNGHINHRKNFVDGVWKTNNKETGSFYLEKQQVNEFFARP